MIPIVIVCFNNYKYVDNMIKQILNINKDYSKNIRVMNNCSSCVDTKKYLQYLESMKYKVYNNVTNNGPWISPFCNVDIWNDMPDKFILTDADLEFSDKMPKNFIEILSYLCDKYDCIRIGSALDISDFDQMYQLDYVTDKDTNITYNIYELEKHFWNTKIFDDNYELYDAPIDTTFHLINKNARSNRSIRVAGNFIVKHLPWYIHNKLYSLYERYFDLKAEKFSTIYFLISKFVENNFLKINKNNEIFLIENKDDDMNLFFWRNIYTIWENETFDIFDRLLDKDKIFIDIGAWIGTTSMYGSRKSKYVYSIEADKKSINDLTKNLSINCKNNYKVINKAIYNIPNIDIKFGKNKFREESKMNDSTSQIYSDDYTSNEYYLIETITLNTFIEENNIDPKEISLIKVDIEGGEENILNDLYNLYKTYGIPLYISFHYDWWIDKNLDRFHCLSDHHKISIINDPFITILFS